jgi:hypothetical protein
VLPSSYFSLGLTRGETIADADPEDINPSILPPAILAAVEADSFWCLSRLLDGIQDNYITAQPGIQRSVKRMAELVARIDAPLSEHLAAQGVEFMQFAFRWMNCLLMREISVKNTVRMWDTYLVRLRLVALLRHREEKQRYTDGGWAYDSQKDRTPFLSFTCTSARRFSSDGATSSDRWISRFVEGFMSVSHPPILTFSSGHHYVLAISADTRLDRPRNRDAPQPGVRAQFDLAQRAESFCSKVN